MRIAAIVILFLALGAVTVEAVVQSATYDGRGYSSFVSATRDHNSRASIATSVQRPSKDKPRGRGQSERSSDIASHAAFSVRLYAALASKDAHVKNGEANDDIDADVAFSPLSIASLLYALAEGANGTTASEIYAALNGSNAAGETGADHRIRESRRRWMSAALQGLVAEPSVSVGSKIFHAPQFNVRPDFIERLQTRYLIKAEPLDFAASTVGAERTVNAWVADATRQHIRTLIPKGTFDQLTALVFVNALYFKADWQTKFDESRTRLRPFHIRQSADDGATYDRAVTMMYVVAEFPYRDFRRFRFEMIELPYTSTAHSSSSMFVVLPHRGTPLSTVVAHLLRRPGIISQPRRRLHNETVTVFLPRFSVDGNSVDLRTSLGALGIVQAFQEGSADLSGIDGSKELYVSDALHKVFVEVDEKGTRASAASGLVIRGRSMSTDPVFRADRPFLYFIRHNPTASILFMGHVAHPKDVATLATPP